MIRRQLPLTLLAILASSTSIYAKDEPELPPCPTSISYFPQNLPMHCRMPSGGPGGTNSNGAQTMPPPPNYPPPYFQSPPPNKAAQPLPYPIPQGPPFPPLPVPMPGPMPMAMPFPGPLPLMGGLPPPPAQKLPVIVMPFYSPDRSYINRMKRPDNKKSRRPYSSSGTESDRSCGRGGCGGSDTDTDTSSDTDTTGTDTSSDTDSSSGTGYDSNRGWWKQKRKRRGGNNKNYYGNYRRSAGADRSRKPRSRRNHDKRRHRVSQKNLLTPIIQYVTNDGYVIYEKEISKTEAKDWLSEKKPEEEMEERDNESSSGTKNKEAIYDDDTDAKEEQHVDEMTKSKTEEVTTTQKPSKRSGRPRYHLRNLMQQQARSRLSPTAMKLP